MSDRYGKVAGAAAARGFDTNVVVAADVARKFVADGYRFCVRYVSHSESEGDSDISRAEVEAILGAGLALMIVQHVRRSGWSPTAALGSSDGALAVRHLQEIGAPPQLTVWTDVEGVDPSAPANNILTYGNAWYKAVAAAGFTPGLYVGRLPLTSAQLYRGLKFRNYWKSGITTVEVQTRGYQMLQLPPANDLVHGIHIDHDATQPDDLGDLPTWWVGPGDLPVS
ncbi:glycoside hydrolase domain-containing protein [Nannocystis bainbridge]|uniref:DUF1906 domain-containing protein n=1 Tax=Nannocystis bainbridge TaxID=2995303 RepID=A0ABT5E8Z8_9BACT|nr:glycoside hydrolase domain-containing protein [Nannocystis bainbridge]MDC0721231.1 DUF1906 domain-containing protein [Nannocystis bainbridge]